MLWSMYTHITNLNKNVTVWKGFATLGFSAPLQVFYFCMGHVFKSQIVGFISIDIVYKQVQVFWFDFFIY